MRFLAENWGSVLVLAAVAAAAAAVVWGMARRRKAGKSGCGSCPARGACQSGRGERPEGPCGAGAPRAGRERPGGPERKAPPGGGDGSGPGSEKPD